MYAFTVLCFFSPPPPPFFFGGGGGGHPGSFVILILMYAYNYSTCAVLIVKRILMLIMYSAASCNFLRGTHSAI